MCAKIHNIRGRNFLTHTHLHPCKLHLEIYDNMYAKIKNLMTQLDGVAFHHLWVSRALTSKSPIYSFCVMYFLAHLMVPYTPHATPLEKGLNNDPPPI
jgi:hypothetical protein